MEEREIKLKGTTVENKMCWFFKKKNNFLVVKIKE